MKNRIVNLIVLAAVFALFVGSADAQKNRRKKAKPAAPPTQTVSTDAGGSNPVYLDGNQIVLGEIPQQETPAATTTTVEPPAETAPAETETEARIRELNARIKSLESGDKNDYDKKQKRLAMNLDILTKAENRAESLRKQLFEMVEKEAAVRTRLEQITFDARPEMIERSSAFVGSLRPEEIRDQKKKSLDAEKRNLETLLTQIQTSRASLEENVVKADFLVEKVRLKLDKDIDEALAEEKDDQ